MEGREETMKIEALVRFNGRDPGDTWEAGKDDAEKWIKNGLARKAGKKKETEAPPEDRAVKAPKKKK